MDNVIIAYSRRIMLRILIFMGILFILLNIILYLDIGTLTLKLSFLSPEICVSKIEQFNHERETGIQVFRGYAFVSLGGFVLCGLFLWMSLRLTFTKMFQSYLQVQKPPDAEKTQEDKTEQENIKRRHLLHLLSVLQREGRLMDFLSENLEEYDDDQIGAAVRSIHENCKKSMSKYLTSEAIIKESEGEDITILPGFDPAAIKLTGNVTGDPPFKGIVRHRGWKVSKIEMPVLSGGYDPNILSPAEVEIT
jgi:hypothetical protein